MLNECLNNPNASKEQIGWKIGSHRKATWIWHVQNYGKYGFVIFLCEFHVPCETLGITQQDVTVIHMCVWFVWIYIMWIVQRQWYKMITKTSLSVLESVVLGCTRTIIRMTFPNSLCNLRSEMEYKNKPNIEQSTTLFSCLIGSLYPCLLQWVLFSKT